jgi:electron transport complex protein RnfC
MINLVNIKNNNKLNIVNQIIDFNLPNNIYIPINDNNLKKDEYIYKNTFLGDFLVSTSGYINDIEKVNFNNKIINCYEIKNDFKENQKTKYKKAKVNNKEDLLTLLNNYKFNSLKNKISSIDIIENLIVTCVDEEVYFLNESLTLANYYDELLNTIDDLMDIFDIDNSILAIKNTNYNSIKNVKSIVGIFPDIKIKLLPDKYLISYKDFICDYLGVMNSNSLVLTISELLILYNLLNAKDICNQIITISGNALEKSLVIKTKLYTSLKELLQELFEFNTSEYDMFVNGYLKGKKINNKEDIIITRDISCIVINKKEKKDETECINCGACKKICPFHINVKKCFEKKYNNKLCIGCGLCNYICPANRKMKETVWGEYNE